MPPLEPGSSRADLATRLVFLAMAAFFLSFAAWVASNQYFVVHGRFLPSYVVVVEGAEAYWRAASLACFGLGLLGPLARRVAVVAWWIGAWFVLAVALPVLHAYLR